MSPRDILFIVLSVSAVACTVVIVWFFIEVIRIFRSVNKTIDLIERHLERVGDIITTVQTKMHDVTGAVLSLTNVLAGVIGFVQRRRRKSTKSDGS